MALERKQSICVRCGDFHLSDTTGFYDEQDNPGGYGAPNPDFGETTPYTASFFAPGQSEPAYVLDLLVNVPEPDDNGHFDYTVTKEQLGFGAQEDIPSGVWLIETTFGEQVTKQNYLATGDIARRITNCICCEGEHNVKLDYELKVAQRLFKCFKTKEAQRAIDRLYKQTAACCGCN